MKKVIISMLLCLVTAYLSGRDFCMYFQGQKVCYKASATKMLVKFPKNDANGIKNALQRSVVNSNSIREIHDMSNGLCMVEMQQLSKENLPEMQRQLSVKENVLYMSPVFADETGREAISYTNEVIVCLKSKDDYPILQKIAKNYSIKSIRVPVYNINGRAFILSLPNNAEKDAAEVSLELHETGLFEFVEPIILYLWPFASNDKYFNNQWGLKNTGQLGGIAGIDINVEPAWTITTGSSSIKVAILDTGVDLNHPDLVDNLLSGYDATGNNTAGAPILVGTSTQDFPHGTKCAGVVAAKGNNNKGVIGVAYNCKILPVTIGRATEIDPEQVANGMYWAVNHQADVISMSFGCRTNYVEAAINNAVTYGRGGKGCVLLACSHNQGWSSSVTFPASSANVMAVGALLDNGQRKPDSNHGPNLDVVAPGDTVYTTGMLGTKHNNVINDGVNGIYFNNFSATSAATPHASGIAALILSVNPNLTHLEVRNIISMTAQKLTGYVFTTTSAHPNGSWNNEVGYGLVDAHAAVQAATCTNSMYNQTISSNKFARSCTNSFTLQNVSVTNNAKLTVKANETSIAGTLQVPLGCKFEIR